MKKIVVIMIFLFITLPVHVFVYEAHAGLGGFVSGEVADAFTNEPVPNVWLSIQTGYGTHRIKTYPNGFFSTAVPAGTNYIIRAEVKGYYKVKVIVPKVTANDSTHVDIILIPKRVKYDTFAIMASNRKFVCADLGKGGRLAADRLKVGPWERFKLYRLNGNRVALQASNGNFVSAEEGRLVANYGTVRKWATFKLIQLKGNRNAFKAANGKYVCAHMGQGGALFADRSQIKEWETFTLVNQ